jgi:hypothetical protein
MKFTRIEDLIGLSTYLDYDMIADGYKNENFKDYEDKAKFIEENRNTWKEINIWSEAEKYFDWKNTHSVKYCDYLVNHTKKLAIDLMDYYKQSDCCINSQKGVTIDAIPVLTETGEGAQMAFFDGISVDTTEELTGQWCGDLLQIVDKIPEGYQLINCCFAEIWAKAKYLYHKYGVNKDDYILKNENGELYEAVSLNYYYERMNPQFIKTEIQEDKIKYYTVKKS